MNPNALNNMLYRAGVSHATRRNEIIYAVAKLRFFGQLKALALGVAIGAFLVWVALAP